MHNVKESKIVGKEYIYSWNLKNELKIYYRFIQEKIYKKV